MSWESLEAIAAVVAALAAVIAIWLQNKSFKANLTADLAMKLDDRFTLPEFMEIRSRAARALQYHINEEDAEDVFDFFETVGLFTRRKALDAEIVHSFFFHWINLYWTAGKDHISKKQRQTHLAWRDFGDLYLKVLKIEKKEDPSSEDLALTAEKLARYLEDEIALCQTRMLTAVTRSDSQTSEGQQ
jgi:hypothetical protein